MKLSVPTLAVGACLITLPVIGLSAASSVAESSGLDFWHVPELQSRIRATERSDAELELQSEQAMRRIALREEVVSELVSGRISFADAARRFAQINRTDPAAMRFARLTQPGNTDEERAARQLIAHVRALGTRRSVDLAADLECELDARILAGD
jgi:hypothetical protein